MIFSLLAFLTLIISVCMRERKKSLIIQSISCLFETIYDFFIFAYTGACLSIFNFIRTFIYINKEKLNKIIYIMILPIFESIVIINCIVTWEGYISLLPTSASIIRTYCLWQTNMSLIRISGLTTGILYGSYYLYHHSWFMVLGDIALSIIAIFTLWKNSMNNRKRYN